MNNLISYGWGTDLPIGSFVNNIHMRILSNAEKFFNKVVLIDTTWLGEENINQVYNQINEISPTIIIICSFIDATFITEQNFKQFDIPVVSIGNFNNQNRIDFWSIMLEHKFNVCDTTLNCVKYPFICYNNKPHPHRVKLYKEFKELNLLNQGAISFGGKNPVLSPENRNNIAYEESGAGNSIINDTMTLGDLTIWNSSFVNIITETEFNPSERHFYSEKTWKPIIGMRPFLHYVNDHTNKNLSELGVKTFENEFSDICDLDLSKHNNIATFCKILVKQNNTYYLKKYNKLWPLINHNYKHFFKFVKKQNAKINNIYY